jgi:hypothetical protein
MWIKTNQRLRKVVPEAGIAYGKAQHTWTCEEHLKPEFRGRPPKIKIIKNIGVNTFQRR